METFVMQADNMALLIIDMQNDFVLPGAPVHVAGAEASIPAIQRILQAFRADNRPVFHITREYRPDGTDVEMMRRKDFLKHQPFVVPGTKGWEIVDQLSPLPGEYRVIKNRFSAFMFTELDLMLRRLGISHLVVTGTQLPNCVRTLPGLRGDLDHRRLLGPDTRDCRRKYYGHGQCGRAMPGFKGISERSHVVAKKTTPPFLLVSSPKK
jgi:hypothetical protein